MVSCLKNVTYGLSTEKGTFNVKRRLLGRDAANASTELQRRSGHVNQTMEGRASRQWKSEVVRVARIKSWKTLPPQPKMDDPQEDCGEPLKYFRMGNDITHFS